MPCGVSTARASVVVKKSPSPSRSKASSQRSSRQPSRLGKLSQEKALMIKEESARSLMKKVAVAAAARKGQPRLKRGPR